MNNISKNKVSTLYLKDQYLDKTIPYLISSDIIEYDIRSAGYSLSRHYHLLNDDVLNLLDTLPKKDRQIKIGLLLRDDAEYNRRLKEAFVNIRKEFFIANSLIDDDILSIKKDAIFLLRRVSQTRFGEDIEFVEKNVYSSYYYINKKEFYVARDRLDVKGISEKNLEPHREYMLDFLHNIFKMIETSDQRYVIKELVSFVDHYKSGNLDIHYYRELSNECEYRLKRKFAGYDMGLIDTDDVDDLNISYNYMNYIRPLISILQ